MALGKPRSVMKSLKVKDFIKTRIIETDARSVDRIYLEEFFVQRPGLNANIDQVYTTEVARGCNKNFEVLGTNATTALATFAATEGGIQLLTAGADNDQMIVTPHLDTTTNQTDSNTGWAGFQWGTENQVIFEAAIRTPASIADRAIWVGLKLTNTPVIATDADQVFFVYNTDSSDTTWRLVSSNTGVDVNTDSGLTVAVSTIYKFKIVITASRTAQFWINNYMYSETAALKNDIDFIPYVGVQQLDNATGDRQITLHYMKISRVLFE